MPKFSQNAPSERFDVFYQQFTRKIARCSHKGKFRKNNTKQSYQASMQGSTAFKNINFFQKQFTRHPVYVYNNLINE